MTGSMLDRAFRMIELLATEANGLKLQEIADRLNIPKSAGHRLLADLVRHGYVRQNGSGTYLLTTKVLSLGYSWLGGSGVADMVQPTLDRLAAASGELVRYAVVEGGNILPGSPRHKARGLGSGSIPIKGWSQSSTAPQPGTPGSPLSERKTRSESSLPKVSGIFLTTVPTPPAPSTRCAIGWFSPGSADMRKWSIAARSAPQPWR